VTARYERERAERLDEARERLDRKEMAGDVATDVARVFWRPQVLSYLGHLPVMPRSG
jgi:hypothetical protein